LGWLLPGHNPKYSNVAPNPPIDQVACSDTVWSANNNDHLMLWFRKQLRLGAWLALVALAINFTLAFGHVHAPDKTGSERQVALIAASAATDSRQSQNHPVDDQADYLCPICMAVAAMGNALAPAPPALAVEFADTMIDHPIDHVRSAPQPKHTAFLSRGPPIS
jgi:site-specific recombinase